MAEQVLIRISNLFKSFRLGELVIHALKDINLEIFQGEYLSIMGPSGSGKSTLFNMVGAGVNLTRLSSRELAYFRGNHIGYVFQSYNLIPAYTAVDNVAMPLVFSGMEQEAAVRRASEVLQRVGLGHRLTHRPDELSGGQQQRVAIARALANSPAIILADEPTGNLDLHTGEEIIALLRQLSKEMGVTVITATHDYKMLDASDRILWIKDGQIDKLEKRADIDIRVGSVH
jgi:putative ABC transport system ATP-binding protein